MSKVWLITEVRAQLGAAWFQRKCHFPYSPPLVNTHVVSLKTSSYCILLSSFLWFFTIQLIKSRFVITSFQIGLQSESPFYSWLSDTLPKVSISPSPLNLLFSFLVQHLSTFSLPFLGMSFILEDYWVMIQCSQSTFSAKTWWLLALVGRGCYYISQN